MAQEQKQPKRSSEVEESTDAPQSDVSERKEQIDTDTDAILEEIDDVLEVNAEDFVRSFVQKGGE